MSAQETERPQASNRFEHHCTCPTVVPQPHMMGCTYLHQLTPGSGSNTLSVQGTERRQGSRAERAAAVPAGAPLAKPSAHSPAGLRAHALGPGPGHRVSFCRLHLCGRGGCGSRPCQNYDYEGLARTMSWEMAIPPAPPVCSPGPWTASLLLQALSIAEVSLAAGPAVGKQHSLLHPLSCPSGAQNSL